MTLPLPSSPHWPPTRMMTTALLGAWFGSSRFEVVEARVVAAEFQLDGACRTISVLGHVDFGDAWFFFGFIVFGPVKKHYNVTVLFYAARLAQVTQDRTLVRALFGRPTQLGNRDHRNPQFAREAF